LSGWLGLVVDIWPNTASPDSRWNDIRLRQAIEYAIDKPAIAKAYGSGLVPVTMLAPPGEWGYDPNYPARTYNPEKARQLLADAGYPDGLDAEMLVLNDHQSVTFGTILKQYLDAVGIRVELDMAEPGRFYSTIYGANPGPDLSVTYSGMDTNFLVTYMRWFSTDPFTNLSYLGHADEQKALDEEAKSIPDAAGQKAMTERLVKYLTDVAMIIPILLVPLRSTIAPYVHTANYSKEGGYWHPEETWMEEH
jgi:ABC-type transport system substrate-binding protein